MPGDFEKQFEILILATLNLKRALSTVMMFSPLLLFKFLFWRDVSVTWHSSQGRRIVIIWTSVCSPILRGHHCKTQHGRGTSSRCSSSLGRYICLSLRLSNTRDDYSEKYGMMGGLVLKQVTAVPVVPSSWSSDWPALPQQLRFWLVPSPGRQKSMEK